MKRSQRYCAAVALALAAMPVATAQAEGPTSAASETTRFEFRSSAGCSSAEDFTARVRRRSWRIHLEPTAPASARALVVEIQQSAPGSALRGIVTVVEPDGSTRTRRLKAATCEEAVDALSLIATVTLDPEAMLGEPEPEAEPPKPEPKPKPAPEPTKPAAIPPGRVETPAAPTITLRVSFGIAGTVLLRTAPEPAIGGTAFVALGIGRGSALSPEFRLGLTHAQRRALREPGGRANFAFTLPLLDVCPLRLGPRRVGLRPCAFVEAGWLKVWGDASGRDESHLRFNGQSGVALLGQLRVSEAFEIVADGRVGAPFTRDSYGFNGVPFFTTPTPVFSASLGAAGGFP